MGFADQLFTLLSLFLSAALILVLTAVLIGSRAPRLSTTLLLILICCRFLSQLSITMYVNEPLIPLWPFLYRSAYPFELSSPPLLYLYVYSLTKGHFRLKDIHWYHGVPFLIGIAWYLYGYLIPLQFSLDKYFRSFVGFVLMIPYLWNARRLIAEVKNQARNQRSSLVELHLPWLQFLLNVCYLSILLTFFDLLTGPDIQLWIYGGGLTNLALLGLTYYGLKASDFFELDLKPPPNDEVQLNLEELTSLSSSLIKLLKESHLYLTPQIRLADIATRMGIKSYKLSQVINQGLNTNFYDLINGMRIEHALRLMHDPTNDHLNLLGISMDCGFNSKSVFNDYFRRKTGITPSKFRQQRSNLPESLS